MEKICDFLVRKIVTELNFDNEKEKVIRYGMFAIIQTVVFIIIVSFLGALFGVLIEALIILFVSSTLRKYSGGAHASTPESCLALGTIICIIIAKLANILGTRIESNITVYVIGIVMFFIGSYIIFKFVPLDNPNKIIKNPKKILKLKKKTFIIMVIFFGISILVKNIFNMELVNKYVLAIYLAIGWQFFTITKLGEVIIHNFDKITLKIISRRAK